MLMTRMQNINPFTHPDAIRKMQKLSKWYINDKMPKGYSLEKKTTLNGTAYQIIRKNGLTAPVKTIYYIHGGCYVCGLVSNYHTFLTDCCEMTGGTQIVLLDYKLAPEYQYPKQLDEAYDLWSELTEKQNIRPENIVIGGDSSGGNLALALMLRLRDEDRKLPAGAFLLPPWTDMTVSGDSYEYNYGNDVEIGEKRGVFTEEKRQMLLESDLFCFVGSADRTDPYVSPVFGEFYGFPPVFFSVGEHEMLLDDSLRIVEKMKKTGIPVICERKPEMFHTYVLYKNYMPESRESFARMKEFIQECMSDHR